ncbi:killer protein [Rahnella sp. ChDrAdgB13]|uniref:killer protein n=1 Tax=Rahnella sp. ChDrAdgB13 TaxID=1850581 RepID=UPI001FCCA80C|nr:killer protein [Rahnella sp. ChDrAdgB13]
MKTTAFAVVMLCLTACTTLPAKADEACNMTLCMWGKVSGSDSDGCQSEIKKFFKKQVTSKGSFLPDHTADARKSMLQKECPATMAPAQFINDIISKFGRLKG